MVSAFRGSPMKKPLKLRMFRYGDEPKHVQGLRILTTRHPPRGLPVKDWPDYFDVWFPMLAPSAALLRRAKRMDLDYRTFCASYELELTSPQGREALKFLAHLVLRTPIFANSLNVSPGNCNPRLENKTPAYTVCHNPGDGHFGAFTQANDLLPPVDMVFAVTQGLVSSSGHILAAHDVVLLGYRLGRRRAHGHQDGWRRSRVALAVVVEAVVILGPTSRSRAWLRRRWPSTDKAKTLWTGPASAVIRPALQSPN
jgi:uncharacterized protein YeaO (DUF488 family)